MRWPRPCGRRLGRGVRLVEGGEQDPARVGEARSAFGAGVRVEDGQALALARPAVLREYGHAHGHGARFVVRVLKAEFRMGEATAQGVMLTAHQLGSCVVAVFTKEVAEEKATRATDMARKEGHPLTFTTEPEE